ncbi:ATP-binding cassette domain-containing protein [Pseudonocardia sp. S2-4]|uniref:ATP-binding cassette domain-containing protein n=1 Tax=Pseudonocardia humida TaxID=2800819 RepID=A0ABT0ZWV6_9PSEU|nr:ATP-binding cassette domain-containing protein [Pseudonocardia humida]
MSEVDIDAVLVADQGSLDRSAGRHPTPDLARVAALAGLEEAVDDLAAGWDTRVGEGGSTLSGGQRQRVSIARAPLKDAPVVVLDEANAALDAAGHRPPPANRPRRRPDPRPARRSDRRTRAIPPHAGRSPSVAGGAVQRRQPAGQRGGIEPAGAQPVPHDGHVVRGAHRPDPDRGADRSTLGVAGLDHHDRAGLTQPAPGRTHRAAGHDQHAAGAAGDAVAQGPAQVVGGPVAARDGGTRDDGVPGRGVRRPGHRVGPDTTLTPVPRAPAAGRPPPRPRSCRPCASL